MPLNIQVKTHIPLVIHEDGKVIAVIRATKDPQGARANLSIDADPSIKVDRKNRFDADYPDAMTTASIDHTTTNLLTKHQLEQAS